MLFLFLFFRAVEVELPPCFVFQPKVRHPNFTPRKAVVLVCYAVLPRADDLIDDRSVVRIGFGDDAVVLALILRDISGKEIRRSTVDHKQVQLDLQDIPNGFYTIELITEKGRGVKKVVVGN